MGGGGRDWVPGRRDQRKIRNCDRINEELRMRTGCVNRPAIDAAPQGAAGQPESFSALHSNLQRDSHPEAAGEN
jgi:hypothetical protein